MTQSDKQGKPKHLFQIEVLIEAPTNGIALEQLTRLLNTPSVADYKINSGIQLGLVIDQAIQDHSKSHAKEGDKIPSPPDQVTAPAVTKTNDNKQIVELIQHFMDNGTLVRLSIIKGKGVKLSLPCRILHYDDEKEQMSVYHVDEKMVYPIRLNEIDDFKIN
jgi:hypothetical protein